MVFKMFIKYQKRCLIPVNVKKMKLTAVSEILCMASINGTDEPTNNTALEPISENVTVT